jgi:hypothetical protein
MLLQTTDGHLHHPLDHFSQLRCDDYSLRGTLGALRLLVVGVSVAHFDYTCRMGKRRQLFFHCFPPSIGVRRRRDKGRMLDVAVNVPSESVLCRLRLPPLSSNPCSCIRMHENQVVHHFVRYRCGFCRSFESHGLRPLVDPQGIRGIGIAGNKRETTQHGIHQDSVPLPGSQSIRRHVPRGPDRTMVRLIT